MNHIPRPTPSRYQHVVVWIVFIVWITLCAVAFWWFQFRHISNYDHFYAHFSGDLTFIKAPVNNTIVVAHILDSHCPCTRFSHPHIRDLEEQFDQQVTFVQWRDLPKSFTQRIIIPASPAVAIWDKNGELAYFGPYSSGAFCGQGEDFVSATLSQLNHHTNPKWINHDALGCFCAYPKPA